MRRGIVEFAGLYAAAIFDADARAMYDGSDFFNVGDWSEGPLGPPAGLGDAARRLVERHLRADCDRSATEVSVVLDVGCGLGAGAAMLARHYPSAMVLGINISFDQVVHARRSVPQACFAVMDGAQLAIADGSADRVHCIEAAFHFDSRERFFAEVHRVLRPGGKAFVSDILFRKDFGGTVPPCNIWTGEAGYRTRCEDAGLIVDTLSDITACTLPPFRSYIAAHGRRAEAVLQRRAQDAYLFAALRKPSR